MGTEPTTDGRVIELDPARIKPFADQPRKRFRGIDALARSIRTIGQVTPILVTPCDGENGYDAELVDGERRLRACLKASLPVRAIVTVRKSSKVRYEDSVAANFCRQPHDTAEIVEAITTLKRAGRTLEEIGGIVGKSKSWVYQHLSLERLVPDVRKMLERPGDETKRSRAEARAPGKLTFSLALLLVGLPADLQRRVARKIVLGRMGLVEARAAVRRLATRAGHKVGRSQADRHKLHSIGKAIDDCYHVTERYVNMPGIEIGAIVRSAPRKERRALAVRIESLCENLLGLSDALAKG